MLKFNVRSTIELTHLDLAPRKLLRGLISLAGIHANCLLAFQRCIPLLNCNTKNRPTL